MNALVLMVFLVLNFGISWWNAWSAGRYWTEVKITKSWPRLLVWAAVVMAAVGFTWVYLTLLTIGAVAFEVLTPEEGEVMFNLGYLILIPGLLLSGTVIWIHSLIRAWRRHQFGDVAIAVYNTAAHLHNTWQAASHAPDALGSVLKFFLGGDKGRRRRSSNSQGAAAFLIILLVILAISGGIITTALIVRHADRQHALDVTAVFD